MISVDLSELEAFKYKPTSETALLVFGFNRPNNLDQLLSSLINQRERQPGAVDVVIFLDGPRSATDILLTSKCEEVAKKYASLPGVYYFARHKNKGLKHSLLEGIGYSVKHYVKFIVLEDDLVIQPGFLTTMLHLIGSIDEYPNAKVASSFTENRDTWTSSSKHKFTLRNRFSCWGWGTTSTIWISEILPALTETSGTSLKQSLSLCLKLAWVAPDLVSLYFRCRQNRANSWAILVAMSQAVNGWRSVHPNFEICSNEGFSSQATHTKKAGYFPRKPAFGVNIDSAIGKYEGEKYRFFPWLICVAEMIVRKVK